MDLFQLNRQIGLIMMGLFRVERMWFQLFVDICTMKQTQSTAILCMCLAAWKKDSQNSKSNNATEMREVIIWLQIIQTSRVLCNKDTV